MKRKWTSREKKIWLLSILLIALFSSVVFAMLKDKDRMEMVELELVLEGRTQDQHGEDNDQSNETEKSDENAQNEEDHQAKEDIEYYVDVKGAVHQPGVYQLTEGARVMDALEKAGQIREDGTTDHINLAQKIYDGMVIYIPTVDEIDEDQLQAALMAQASPGEGAQGTGQISSSSNKININRASAEELQKLPGVGASRAQDIVNYRTEKGDFQSLEDLMNISGIGPKIFERLKELIEL